jgi:sulfur transfer protein SufE
MKIVIIFALAVLSLACFFSSYNAFITTKKHHIFQRMFGSTKSTSNNFENLIKLSNNIINNMNTTETLLNLVELSYSLKVESFDDKYDIHQIVDNLTCVWMEKNLRKVEGCIADVRLQLALRNRCNDKKDYEIIVNGQADSKIALGMLSLLVQVIRHPYSLI